MRVNRFFFGGAREKGQEFFYHLTFNVVLKNEPFGLIVPYCFFFSFLRSLNITDLCEGYGFV